MTRTITPVNMKENISISVGMLCMALPKEFQNANYKFYFERNGDTCWFYSEKPNGYRAGVRA